MVFGGPYAAPVTCLSQSADKDVAENWDLLKMSEMSELMAAAVALAEHSSATARALWQGEIDVTYKSDGSSLTEADLNVEALWRDRIRSHFPSHGILGEEYGQDSGTSAYTWVLDPIDGTRQFGAGLLNFSSLISVCRDGVPVVGVIDLPHIGSRWVAALGHGTRVDPRPVQTSGCSDIDTAVVSLANPDSFGETTSAGYARLRNAGRLRVFDAGSPAYGALARGLIDVCLNGDDLNAHDICALCPVVTEAGGVITDWSGGPLSLSSSGAIVATASPDLHAHVLGMLAGP